MDRAISKGNLCKSCREHLKKNLPLYEAKLNELTNDRFLDEGEERELSQLQNNLALSENDIVRILPRLEALRDLRQIRDGKLPVIAQPDILLKKNEVCHFVAPVQLAEERTRTHYVGGTRGVSVRIAKGLSYRVGGFKGERVSETHNLVTDSGDLVITNKRVVFSGQRKNVTYQLKSLVGIIKFNNGIQFQRENEAKPKYFIMNDWVLVDRAGLIVDKLVLAIS